MQLAPIHPPRLFGWQPGRQIADRTPQAPPPGPRRRHLSRLPDPSRRLAASPSNFNRLQPRTQPPRAPTRRCPRMTRPRGKSSWRPLRKSLAGRHPPIRHPVKHRRRRKRPSKSRVLHRPSNGTWFDRFANALRTRRIGCQELLPKASTPTQPRTSKASRSPSKSPARKPRVSAFWVRPWRSCSCAT